MQTATPATLPNTPMPPRAPRLRSAKALARAVVRDLANQDAPELEGYTAAVQIKQWRRAASDAGDTVIADALDLLGPIEAARVYRSGRRASSLDAAEREKLNRSARKARGQ